MADGVRLAVSSAAYLRQYVSDPAVLGIIEAAIRGNEISVEDASELREVCADLLTTEGFDEKYSPTGHGIRLEGLIDELYAE
jgi:hypothetical protein